MERLGQRRWQLAAAAAGILVIAAILIGTIYLTARHDSSKSLARDTSTTEATLPVSPNIKMGAVNRDATSLEICNLASSGRPCRNEVDKLQVSVGELRDVHQTDRAIVAFGRYDRYYQAYGDRKCGTSDQTDSQEVCRTAARMIVETSRALGNTID